MTEKQAEQQGYRFTGSYERSREAINERKTEYKGYKVVVCTVPDSPLSRGIKGTGYSIYAEEKYFIDREIKELQQRLSCINNRKQSALDEYNKQISLIEQDQKWMEDRMNELSEKCIK